MVMLRIPAALAVGTACLLTAGCGAGLIGGVIASSNNGGSPPAAAAIMSIDQPGIPLVPSGNPLTVARRLVISNAQLPATAAVQISALVGGHERTVDQGSWTIISGQGTSTLVVGFVPQTQPFTQFVEPSSQDVPGELRVVADGRDVAPPVPVTLLRQPVAALPGGVVRLNLSPLGGTRATLDVSWLHATTAEDLQMFVTTRDAGSRTGTITRPCTDLTFDPTAAEVSAVVPGNAFSGPASLFVDDRLAGRSKPVGDPFALETLPVVYQPEITVALPAQGPTTGGSLVTLIGAALAPLDFGAAPPRPDFGRIQLLFRKGPPVRPAREVRLPAEALRTAESSLDRLVFTMPPSPDGRPGRVDIVLRTQLGATQSEVVADRVFLFANPQPVFGPRGAVLDRLPVAVTPIRLEGAPNGNDAPDFGVLYSEGGVAFLQLLMAEENGMFIRFGQPTRIGDPEQAAEREPRDLVASDFDGDRVPDFVIANAGAAQATFHVVQGQPAPNPPLGHVTRVAADPATARCAVADFDEDGVPDLVLLPAADAPAGALPRVMLARPAPGAPGFVPGAQVPVRPLRYEALAVADFDGDQHLDVAVVTGGSQPRLDVGYGTGTGAFSASSQLDFAVPGYVADPGSPAVGVHAVGSGPLRSVAVVLAGLPPPPGQLPPHPTTPPVVAVLHQTAARTFAAPVGTDVLVGPVEPLGLSLLANIDGAGEDEMVLAVRGDRARLPLLLLQYDGTRFQLVGAQDGSEGMLSISALHFGTAFPANPQQGHAEARAVFVVHESVADGVRERRLSTMLVFSDPQGGLSLLAPDAGGPLPLPVHGLISGNFSAISVANAGAARDLALAMVEDLPAGHRQIQLLNNEGFGGFPSPGIVMREDLLVPQTMALVPAAPGVVDSVAFFTEDGRVGLWQPDDQGGQVQSPTFLSPVDLRLFAANPALHTAPVAGGSRLQAADVDGDGVTDLVALLTFDALNRVEGDALLLVLRGKPSPGPGEFPFELPAGSAAVAPVHGNASSFALGDFAAEPTGAPVRLEMALAVPVGDATGASNGDHVRFYRLEAGPTPAEDRWVRSFDPGGAQVLLAGDAPTRVAATDFDGNGTVDLLVASAGDASLHLFLNSGLPASEPQEVAIESLQEGFASPYAAAPGLPTFLNLGDINGDGNVDVLLTTEATTLAGARTTSVSFYLSSGAGELTGPSFVPQTRLGDRDATLSVDLADFNGDGVPDLPLAWSTPGGAGRNVLVLFGGSR